MGKVQNDQSAFSVIEALLILVIVSILGFTGWFVWHAKSIAEKSLNSNNSTTPVIKKKITTNTNMTTPVSTATYLEAKEAKIKFPIPGVLADAYYFSDPNDSSGLTTTFSTHSLDAYNIAACKAQAKPNSEVSVEGAVQLYFNEVESKNNAVAQKKVGDYWFSIEAYKDCKSDDPAIQAKITAIQAAFEKATQSLTAL